MLSIIIFALAIGLMLILASLQKKVQALRQLSQGLLVTYITIMLMLLLGEAYFRFVYAESTGMYTLANLNWLERYYHENSWGYRDREWQAEDFLGRTVVTVLGDSFTAGSGLNNPEDRYSNVLASYLGDEYAVVNLGLPGTATPQHLEALQNFDLAQPEIVIWQYYLNDIHHAALSTGSLPALEPFPEIAWQSYLLNFLYFRLSPSELDYRVWHYDLYDNPVIWATHQAEIEALVDYVERIDAELIVLIYPIMIDPVGSIPYVDRVAQAIEAQGQNQILKLFDAVASWPAEQDLIVSLQDSHPSVAFNHYVAERLYELYFVNTP